MILFLIRRNFNIYLVALKMYALLKRSKVIRHQDKIRIKNGKNQIILSISNMRFVREIIDFFYFYFDSVKVEKSIVDFSEPKLHRIAFKPEMDIWFPSTSEPVETFLQYKDILKITGGEIVLDLGAYSCLSSILFLLFGAERVVSVEADPKNLECCDKNLEIHRALINGRIDLYKFALSSKDGWAKFLSEGTMASRLVKQKYDSSEDCLLVETRTLTSLAKFYNLKKVDIIKADIEGAEFDVFSDGEFFMTYKPKILLEPINKKEAQKIIKLFKSYDYRTFSAFKQAGSRQELLLCEAI